VAVRDPRQQRFEVGGHRRRYISRGGAAERPLAADASNVATETFAMKATGELYFGRMKIAPTIDDTASEPERQPEPCRTRIVDLGRSRLTDIDNIAEALAIAEGENFH
jgi:hypothetical protein